MSENPFKKATKQESYLRMALTGPSGGGKTYTALAIATVMGKTAVLDTERGSASKYADLFDFDVLAIDTFNPDLYIRAIDRAVEFGYKVMVIDSLSHAWFGVGGVLEIVDQEKKRGQNRNEFAAWKVGTQVQNKLVDAILNAPIHIIATMRSKTEYVIGEDQKPRKVGLAPVQRDGMEYEFDVIGVMDIENNMIVDKSRCPALTGKVISKPGASVAKMLSEWLTDGEPAEDTAPEPPADAATETPDDTPFPAQHDRADTTREPETRDAHSEAPSAAQPSDYDPAIDTRVFTQHTWTHLNGWMVRTMDNIDKSIHAVNALWKSLEEHADRLYDNADRVELFKQVVVDKKSFKHLYAANLTVAQVWNAIAAHYYGELADAA